MLIIKWMTFQPSLKSKHKHPLLFNMFLEKMEKVVCVTGASGYIASWLIKLLLDRGYTIKATVRTLNDPRKVDHLKALDGADQRLHLYEADLLNEGCFDSIVDGCQGVFHTASPVSLAVSDPQKELIEPAVNGTINVLKSCNKASSVKRVVITSSMASVMLNYRPINADVVIDETWFSDTDFCKEKKEWYAVAKTLAEKAAWEFAEVNRLDLVMLHPGFVIGPLLQPTLNFTSKAVANLINEGKELWPNGVYRYVDVRDVALAHILAFEDPSATGRYCLVSRVTRSSEALRILRNNFPSFKLPQTENDDERGPPYDVSKEKAKCLGIDFTDVEVSLKDTIESLKQKGFISLGGA